MNNGGEVSIKQVILSFQEWILFFASKWKFILLFIIVGAGLGFLLSILSTKKYVAEASFVLQEADQQTSLFSAFGIPGQSQDFFQNIDNIIWLYSSNAMLKKVLLQEAEIDGKKDLLINGLMKEINLQKDLKKRKSPLAEVKFNVGKANNSINHSAIINLCNKFIIKDFLEVTSVPKTTNVIALKLRAKNEQFAKVFLDKLVETVSEFYISTKTKKLKYEVDAINLKMDSIKRNLDANIYDVANNSDVIPYPNPSLQVLGVNSKKSMVDVQVMTATYAQLSQNMEAMQLELSKSTPLIQVIDSPEYPLAASKISSTMGIIIGSISFTVLSLIYLFLKRYYKMVMAAK